MGKSPGFWFFTGDWLKDSELRFCSIFARGLLVDLLCLMFESKEMGFLSKPDGSARPDEEIVNAISGSTTQEKLKGLLELEQSGVLSRDCRGVLYSRRLSRLKDISNERRKAGSKGGATTQANAKQTAKQNRGVTVSVSDSVSDIKTLKQTELRLAFLSKEFSDAWRLWERHRGEKMKPIGDVEGQQQQIDLSRFDESEAIEIIRFTIGKGAVNLITNGDHRKRETVNGFNKKNLV